jgi:hypothetical protein
MSDAPTAYPLAWPPGRPRTKVRKYGHFNRKQHNGSYMTSAGLTLSDARERVRDEISRIDAMLTVISSDVPKGRNTKPADPGVAVYFTLKGKPIVLACDRYTEVAQNIAAVAAHLEATRAIERHGVATMEQMFTGFLALPAPIVPGDWRGALGNPASLTEAEAAWKERMRRAHPDAGGSVAEAAVLNAAIGRARHEWRG